MIFNNFILPVISSQIQFFPHYVIVHKEAATDVKVAASGNAHAQMLIKVQSLIAAVDIQFEGFSTAFLHGLLSSIEERLAISLIMRASSTEACLIVYPIILQFHFWTNLHILKYNLEERFIIFIFVRCNPCILRWKVCEAIIKPIIV